METLVLNKNYLPLKVISWQKAICLYFLDKVRVERFHETTVRSAHAEHRVPSVVVLKRYVSHDAPASFSREGVFQRDDNKCQYCGARAYTVDHVIPKSKGGDNSWTNVVACCQPCNAYKGDLTLREAGMRLFRKPREPMAKKIKSREGWEDYLIMQ